MNAKATAIWTDAADPFVTCNPCIDSGGTLPYDGATTLPGTSFTLPAQSFRVYLPRGGSDRDPQVYSGEVLPYFLGWSGDQTGWGSSRAYHAGDYLGPKIGTVCMWNLAVGVIPQGWRQIWTGDRFLRGAAAAGTGTFGTTGTDYDYRDVICIERFQRAVRPP